MSGAATQAAPAPAAGMQRIPFPVRSYQHASPPLSSERLLNFYIEKQTETARTQAALIPTGGLELVHTVGDGPIYAMDDTLPGRVYLVSGSHAFRIRFETTGTFFDDLGDVGTPDGSGSIVPADQVFVTIAAGPTAAVICVPPNAWTCTHAAGDPLVQLGGTFTGASSVAYLDGYWAFTDFSNSARWFISRLMDPTNFDALDFAYSDGLTNVLRRVYANRGQFWMIGQAGIEVWYDAGQRGLPVPPCAWRHDPLSAPTVRTAWLGWTIRCSGWGPISWSTARSATMPIGSLPAPSRRQSSGAASPMLWASPGPTLATVSIACRRATARWCLIWPAGNGTTARQVPMASHSGCPVALSGAPIPAGLAIGDSGNLYTLLSGGSFDNGVPVLRSATCPPVWASTRRAFCSRVELEMESGTDPSSITLEWSDDGGFTWNGGPRALNSGPIGAHRKRVFTTRLGSFRQRVFRITTQVAVSLYALDADITAGAS